MKIMKTIRQLLTEEAIYSSTSLIKKINMLKDYIADNKKSYSIDTTDVANVLEMLKIVIDSSKGAPKSKMLVILSQYGYEFSEESLIETCSEHVSDGVKEGLVTQAIDVKIKTLQKNVIVSDYVVVDLLREIDSIAKTKIDKKKNGKMDAI